MEVGKEGREKKKKVRLSVRGRRRRNKGRGKECARENDKKRVQCESLTCEVRRRMSREEREFRW